MIVEIGFEARSGKAEASGGAADVDGSFEPRQRVLVDLSGEDGPVAHWGDGSGVSRGEGGAVTRGRRVMEWGRTLFVIKHELQRGWDQVCWKNNGPVEGWEEEGGRWLAVEAKQRVTKVLLLRRRVGAVWTVIGLGERV